MHSTGVRQSVWSSSNHRRLLRRDGTESTYDLVGTEKTKYRESIEIFYDPSKISFAQLLDIYWKQINPTQSDGQVTDIGPSYRRSHVWANDNERKLAEESKEKLAKSGKRRNRS